MGKKEKKKPNKRDKKVRARQEKTLSRSNKGVVSGISTKYGEPKPRKSGILSAAFAKVKSSFEFLIWNGEEVEQQKWH
jgi:hypothetical protein